MAQYQKVGDSLNKRNKRKYNRTNIKYNNIKITKHVIEQYRSRICKEDTDEEIIEFLTTAVNEGKIKSIRDSIYESGLNKTEVRFLYYSYLILGIIEPDGTLSVVTCTGDKTQRGWYRKEVIGIPYKVK